MVRSKDLRKKLDECEQVQVRLSLKLQIKCANFDSTPSDFLLISLDEFAALRSRVHTRLLRERTFLIDR